MVDGLIIRSSSIHAAGCYTTRRIKKGTRVIEYDGPRFMKDEADERYKDRDITYLFSCGEDNDRVIDGFGTAMFINHSAIRTASRKMWMDESLWLRFATLLLGRS